MIYLGLVGYPLGHSLSPKLHCAALQSCGLEGDYSLFPIAPEDKQSLKDLLSRIRCGEFHGLNVTVPHKQNVISLLDELTPTAQAIGAVNTIYMQQNKLIGHNTDAPGFIKHLDNFLASNQSKIEHRKLSIVLGSGGSARAVVYALLNNGWTVTIAARRIEQAQQIAASFPGHKLHITNDLSDFELSDIALIVNTTPVGMTPNVDKSPWPEKLCFPSSATIYDLVYNPHETKLVKDAWKQGLEATTGIGMLVEQAALAFETWTGRNPCREIMSASLEQFSNLESPITNLTMSH